tara:strand:- start:1878 stop:2774 length:897 start_codon:yes stop_codon:yes gene_type:complete
MFFDRFPVTLYDVEKNGTQHVVVDILKRVIFREELKNEASLFFDYIIKDGETPEIVAHRFLGDTKYHWIILLLNEIIDPYFQWPMSEQTLETYTEKKYPGQAIYLKSSSASISESGEVTDDSTDLKFIKDEEVYIINNKGTRGLVKEWDPTYRKLVLYSTNGNFNINDTLIGKTSGSSAKITRLVDLNSQALHHFEDTSEDYLYDKLDPLGTPPLSGQQVAMGLTGPKGGAYESTAATWQNTILYSYINRLDESVTTHTVVTNQENERRNNEKNRTVKILRTEYIETVVENFKKAINS